MTGRRVIAALAAVLVLGMSNTPAGAVGGCTIDGNGRLDCGARFTNPGSGNSPRENGGGGEGGTWQAVAPPVPNAFDCTTIPGAAATPTDLYRLVAGDFGNGAAFIGEFCVVVPPNTTWTPPAPPTLEEILDAANTPDPVIELNPAAGGLTGLATHLWYDGPTTIAVAVTIRGYTVTGRAWLETVTWDTGQPDRNGTTTYQHPATGAGTEGQPAVRHVYETKGATTITAAFSWTGEFTITGNGLIPRAVDLGTVTLDTTRTYPITEARSVLTR